MTQEKRTSLEAGIANLGVVLLGEGEVTKVVRIRGESEAVEWFANLSAAERGRIVEVLHQHSVG